MPGKARTAAALGALGFLAVSCAGDASSSGGDSASVAASGQARQVEVIEVDEPLLIGFFPVVPAEARGDAAVASALEHLAWVMAEAEECLRSAHVEVREVHARALVFENQGTRDELHLDSLSNDSMGCYLVAPGRPAQIVRASAGPSSLLVLCPAAAASYFDVPGCCPDGFLCCPDGRLNIEGYECNG